MHSSTSGDLCTSKVALILGILIDYSSPPLLVNIFPINFLMKGALAHTYMHAGRQGLTTISATRSVKLSKVGISWRIDVHFFIQATLPASAK